MKPVSPIWKKAVVGGSASSMTFTESRCIKRETGEHAQKLRREILWLLQYGDLCQPRRFPRIFRWSMDDEVWMEMERVHGTNLRSELLARMENRQSTDDLLTITAEAIEFDIYELSRQSGSVEIAEQELIGRYVEHVRTRLRSCAGACKAIGQLLEDDSLHMRDRCYPGFNELMDLCLSFYDGLQNNVALHLIHGDLNLANILLAAEGWYLVDPRGSGILSSCLPVEDIAYDLAKIRHDAAYVLLKSGQLRVSVEHRNGKALTQICLGVARELAEDLGYFGLSAIEQALTTLDQSQSEPLYRRSLLIEGLLFLSMLPFHCNDASVAESMYAYGVVTVYEALTQAADSWNRSSVSRFLSGSYSQGVTGDASR